MAAPAPAPVSTSRSALVLLVALVGGLGAASVHVVVHSEERAANRAVHLADGTHVSGGAGDHARAPCGPDLVHEPPCAVCQGLGSGVLEAARVVGSRPPVERVAASVGAHAVYRRAIAPARGPPLSVV